MNENIRTRRVDLTAWADGRPHSAWVWVWRHYEDGKEVSAFHYSNVSAASIKRLANLAHNYLTVRVAISGDSVGWTGETKVPINA